MIPLWKVQAIEALLAEDALSQRAIARQLPHYGWGNLSDLKLSHSFCHTSRHGVNTAKNHGDPNDGYPYDHAHPGGQDDADPSGRLHRLSRLLLHGRHCPEPAGRPAVEPPDCPGHRLALCPRHDARLVRRGVDAGRGPAVEPEPPGHLEQPGEALAGILRCVPGAAALSAHGGLDGHAARHRHALRLGAIVGGCGAQVVRSPGAAEAQ